MHIRLKRWNFARLFYAQNSLIFSLFSQKKYLCELITWIPSSAARKTEMNFFLKFCFRYFVKAEKSELFFRWLSKYAWEKAENLCAEY